MDPDKAFAVQVAHEEGVLTTSAAYMQCALLYTSSSGERRIRCALPQQLRAHFGPCRGRHAVHLLQQPRVRAPEPSFFLLESVL